MWISCNECEFHVCSNYLTNEYLSNVSYSSTGIVKVLANVNPSKAHCILNYDFEILILWNWIFSINMKEKHHSHLP